MYVENGVQYNEQSGVNIQVLKDVAKQLVLADITDLVWPAITMGDGFKNDNIVALDRLNNPQCMYCGSTDVPWVDLNKSDLFPELPPSLVDPDEIWGVDIIMYDYDAETDTFVEMKLGEDVELSLDERIVLRCVNCGTEYHHLSELDYSCDFFYDRSIQWLLMSEDKEMQLRKCHQIVLKGLDHYIWGRRNHYGDDWMEDVWKEPVIFQIAYDAKLLQGQPNCKY